MKNLSLLLILIFFCLKSQALDVDEKLTLRLLKVSSSKKTILINRGVEDGLVVGDHAKFFLTTGMVARGVVVKTSPSRTVWSLYRLISPELITTGKVLNLKIATPVKITEDQTRMIVDEPPTLSAKVDIPVAPGGDDMDREIQRTVEDSEEIKSLMNESSSSKSMMPAYRRHRKFWEIYSYLHVNSLSTSLTTTSDAALANESGSSGSMDVTLGFERYFEARNTWYSDLSVGLLLHIGSVGSVDADGNDVQSGFTEYGVGVNWHFLAGASSINRLIGFVVGTVGTGSSSDEGTISGIGNTYDGSVSFYSLGVGLKYYVNSFGARAVLDYYSRSETYTISTADVSNDVTKTTTGPRILLGGQWRF